MTLTEDEKVKLELLTLEKEELERKANEKTIKPGMAGMVNNVNENETIDIIQKINKGIPIDDKPNYSSLLKEKLSKSPNISLKDIKKYLESIGKINISDGEIKNIIKETADPQKYNEIYSEKINNNNKLKKEHRASKWRPSERKEVIQLLKETNYDKKETRRIFIKNNPDTGRSTNATSLYIGKLAIKLTSNLSTDSQQNTLPGTAFKTSEKNILYPEFDKIIQLGKSITDYPEIYRMYRSSSPNHIKSTKSVSDHFYHYRKKYRNEHKIQKQTNNYKIQEQPNNNHILGVKILELIRSGSLPQDILSTYKTTIRELLSIQDAKPEEIKSAVKVLEFLKP